MDLIDLGRRHFYAIFEIVFSVISYPYFNDFWSFARCQAKSLKWDKR